MSSAFQHATLDRFGTHYDFLLLPNVNTGKWPVIDEAAFAWSAGAVTVLSTFIGLLRIILKYNHKQRLDFDDSLFIFALCCCIVSAVLIIYSAEYFYMEARLLMGSATFADYTDLIPGVNQYLQILNGVSATAWLSIYSVKFCYLMFFNKLTKRIAFVRQWWWFVLGVTIGSCFVACLIGLWICHDFGPDILVKCPIPVMNTKAGTWNKISASLDIATDVMIVSIPVFLISKTKVNKRRKIAVGTILCLSAAMIIIAFIRLFPPTANLLSIDGPWFFFWICIEADIAIIMVSVTAFKSIFKSARISPESATPRASWGVFSRIRSSMQVGFDKLIAWDNTRISTVDGDTKVDDVETGIRVDQEMEQHSSIATPSTTVSGPDKAYSIVSTMNPAVSPLSTRQDDDKRDTIRMSWGGLRSHPVKENATLPD